MGSTYIGPVLYMPCVSALRYNPVIMAVLARLVERGKPGMSAVIACMAKLLKIVYGVLTHGPPLLRAPTRA